MTDNKSMLRNDEGWMKRQSSIVQVDKGATPESLSFMISHSATVPSPPSGYVLVRTLAVALNPFDHKMAEYFPAPGASVGCDFCGIVEQPPSLSSDDKKEDKSEKYRFQAGQRVCGSLVGNNPQRPWEGAFSQYIVAEADLLICVPPGWSDVDAAALGGVGWKTAALALWDSATLALSGRPSSPYQGPPVPVIVYGGTTATGTMACQLLKLSGYFPIAVTSPDSATLAIEYGATVTASHTSPSCIEDIQQKVRAIGISASIRHVIDCITDARSAAICMATIGRVGGRYACLEAFNKLWQNRRTVNVELVMCPEANGVVMDVGPVAYTRPHNRQRYEIGLAAAKEMQALIDHGLIRNHPVEEVEGGWEGILTGLEMLRSGRVRGKKLVVRIPA
ncbi:hypothetical protein FOPG_16776 [Fusarium oxysporum f. sp. conglutinans race 2 54008]|uniref:Enoyl reductase (ER) domain-containing protein n=1 Tax=Fusarium oxysporum f. sp. conglutinans race 2 54008 TaxID=1089457 RepID=X0GTW4_FUSOX|nr:hypothetical protein FOPG_16776 [Fusarium oxysporum f. sp. conglutinans race 2 54008]